MAAPKAGTVVLVLALLACVAVYVLGLGLGATDRSRPGQSSVSKARLQELQERFFRKRPVEPGELTVPCARPDGTLQVASGRTCQVDIAPTSTRLRTVAVVPLSGSRVDVTLAPGGKEEPAVPASFKNLGEAKELDVFREGGRLTLACRRPGSAGTSCLVRLE